MIICADIVGGVADHSLHNGTNEPAVEYIDIIEGFPPCNQEAESVDAPGYRVDHGSTDDGKQGFARVHSNPRETSHRGPAEKHSNADKKHSGKKPGTHAGLERREVRACLDRVSHVANPHEPHADPCDYSRFSGPVFLCRCHQVSRGDGISFHIRCQTLSSPGIVP